MITTKDGKAVLVDAMIHMEIQAAIERIAKDPLLADADPTLVSQELRKGIQSLLDMTSEREFMLYFRLHRGDETGIDLGGRYRVYAWYDQEWQGSGTLGPFDHKNGAINSIVADHVRHPDTPLCVIDRMGNIVYQIGNTHSTGMKIVNLAVVRNQQAFDELTKTVGAPADEFPNGMDTPDYGVLRLVSHLSWVIEDNDDVPILTGLVDRASEKAAAYLLVLSEE